jgi:hypothetical protein
VDRVCVRAMSVSFRATVRSERYNLVGLFRLVTSSGSRVVGFHVVVQMDLRIRACLMGRVGNRSTHDCSEVGISELRRT